MTSIPMRTILAHFFREFSQNKWFFVAIIAAIGANIAYTFDAYLTAQIVDNLRLFLDGKNTTAAVYQPFFWIIGIGVMTWACFRIMEIGTAKWQTQTAQTVYNRIFRHLHHHSHEYFTNNFAGSLFKKMTRYVRAFEDFGDILVGRITPLLIHMSATVFVVCLFSPLGGLIIIVYVMIFVLLSWWFVRWQHALIDKHDRLDSTFSGYVTDTIANHSTILSFGKFDTELKQFDTKCRTTYQILYRAWRRGNIMYSTLGLLSFSSYWIVTGFAIYLALGGHILFATFLIISTYNGTLTDRIWDVSNIFKQIGKIVADAREGMEILATEHSVRDMPKAKKLIAKQGHIEFKNMTFGYGKEKIFTNLNLVIHPREKIGIVGVSGSGKSTLTKLLMRLYDIDSGHIMIDNFDISQVSQESLHKNIALVPQDPVLFHRTLAENIRYPQPDISEKDFQKYCHIARCDTFIEKLPDTYETLVGERGVKLSGGERQRVAIARALIAETPIIIFDEATSALDSESEQYIQEAMFDAIEGKTALVIAHRLSTIVHLERILVFENGKIIEDGSHAELMKHRGVYAKLWTIQSGEFRE